MKYTDPTGHQQEPWYEKLADSIRQLVDGVQGWWYSINPCTMSASCPTLPSFAPPTPENLTKKMMGPVLIDPAQVEQFKDILEIQDQAVRAAELAKIFEYKPPVEGGPGTYDYALLSPEDRAKSFAETYGLPLDGVDVVYDPSRGSGRLGQYLAPGDEYRGVVYERETLILGPDAFSDSETLGSTIFHELVHHADPTLSEEGVRELEDAWREWYKSLPPEQQ